MNDDMWIVIPHWPDYQHYGQRDPIWIKDYRSQLVNAEYLKLSFHLRGLLGNLRLAYADSDGQLPGGTLFLTRRLGVKVLSRDLKALVHAGFIDVVASRPLALARSREKRREEKRKPVRSRAEKQPQPLRTNVDANDPYSAVERMIRNGVITDPIDLDAELRGYHLDGALANELRHKLATQLTQ